MKGSEKFWTALFILGYSYLIIDISYKFLLYPAIGVLIMYLFWGFMLITEKEAWTLDLSLDIFGNRWNILYWIIVFPIMHINKLLDKLLGDD